MTNFVEVMLSLGIWVLLFAIALVNEARWWYETRSGRPAQAGLRLTRRQGGRTSLRPRQRSLEGV